MKPMNKWTSREVAERTYRLPIDATFEEPSLNWSRSPTRRDPSAASAGRWLAFALIAGAAVLSVALWSVPSYQPPADGADVCTTDGC